MVIDFITAFFKKENEELVFKSYVADSLNILCESMGAKINLRFANVLKNFYKPQDNRSGEEIATEVIEKVGLVVVDK